MPQLHYRELAAPARSPSKTNQITECLGAFEQRVIGELLRVRHRQLVEDPLPSRILDLVRALEHASLVSEVRDDRLQRMRA